MKKRFTLLLLATSLTAYAGKIQCKGTTKAGKQCTRKADDKIGYCYQHNPSNPVCLKCKHKALKGHSHCRTHLPI